MEVWTDKISSGNNSEHFGAENICFLVSVQVALILYLTLFCQV